MNKLIKAGVTIWATTQIIGVVLAVLFVAFLVVCSIAK